MKALVASVQGVRATLRSSLGRDREPGFPVVALLLALGVLGTALATGVFAHELSPALAGHGAFGWTSLRAGRWWTVVTSFFLTRNWFMAATMPVCLFLALALYERRAGHVRAFWVATVGHVTGSVVVAVGAGALGWTGQPILERAAQNLDYGGSMGVAAALGALASRLGNRRVRWLVFGVGVVALPLHHQMADWGHIVALPAGYLVDRVRQPKPSLALFAAFTGLTVALAAFGPAAVDATAASLRFGDSGAALAPPSERMGQLTTWTYNAGLLGYRPETVQVYLPPGRAVPRPVIVFLHDLPGSPNDWVAGGGTDQLLADHMAAHTFPRAIAVFAAFDGYRVPSAGWLDAPGQPTLQSLALDMVPALARSYPGRVNPTAVAVVGVGQGANGALGLARLDHNVRWVVALDPTGGAPSASPATQVLLERSPDPGWGHWRAEMPAVLDWLAHSGFAPHFARRALR